MRSVVIRPVVVAAALAAGLGPLAATAHADAAFTLATPYPEVETQPGSTVKLDLAVTSPATDAVDLGVDGVPEGWTATMRGGGFVVHAVTAGPDSPAKATLELDIPADAAQGSYPLTITGADASGASTAIGVVLDVASQVDNGIELTADFPSLKGEPASVFTYNLTVANNTPEAQTFTFAPTAPQGWTATASPTAEAKAETVSIEAGDTATVKVTATPPDTAEQGTYPIDVEVTAANGASGHIQLSAEVTGTPKLQLTTADQRLDVSGGTGEHRIPLVVGNGGSAPLEAVKLAGTAPTGWDVSFDPKELAEVKPNETAQVTAIVTPASGAVAGDYALTIRSSAGSDSSNIDLRYSLHGSRTVGVLAIAVIVAALGALGWVFVRFGRR